MSVWGKVNYKTNTVICWNCGLEQPNWLTTSPTCSISECLRPGEYPEDSEYYIQHKARDYYD